MKKLIVLCEKGNFWKRPSNGTSQNFKKAFVYDLSYSSWGVSSIDLTLNLILTYFKPLEYLTRNCPTDFTNHTFKIKRVKSKVFKGKSWIEVYVFKGDVQVVGILPQVIESDYCEEFTSWVKYNENKIAWTE
jgi:hypothetical protein